MNMTFINIKKQKAKWLLWGRNKSLVQAFLLLKSMKQAGSKDLQAKLHIRNRPSVQHTHTEHCSNIHARWQYMCVAKCWESAEMQYQTPSLTTHMHRVNLTGASTHTAVLIDNPSKWTNVLIENAVHKSVLFT